jgi:hypothetical protein
MTIWTRYDLAPWVKSRGNTAVHGLKLGDRSWVELRKYRDHDLNRTVWLALWAPAGFDGLYPSIVVKLFETRRLLAAKLLVELWASTKPAVKP